MAPSCASTPHGHSWSGPTLIGFISTESLPPPLHLDLNCLFACSVFLVGLRECQPFWAALANSPHCPAPSRDGGGLEGPISACAPTDYGLPFLSRARVHVQTESRWPMLPPPGPSRLSPLSPEPGDSLLHWGQILSLGGFSRRGEGVGWGPGEDGEVPEVEPLVVASCPSPPALSPVPHSFWGSTGPGGWGGVGQRGALGPLLLPCAPRTPTCGGCRHPGLSCFGSIRSAWPEGSEAPTWFSVPSLPAGSPEGEGHAGPSTPAPTPCSPPPHPPLPSRASSWPGTGLYPRSHLAAQLN